MTAEAIAARTTGASDDISTEDEARALCVSLSRIAAQLSDVIERETDVVAAGLAYEIESFHADKAELSAHYLAEMTRLKQHAATVRSLVPDAVEMLKPQLRELGAKLLRNQDALAAVLALSERLIRTAAMKAIETDSGPRTYGSDGHIGACRPSNPAAAIDRQL